MGQQADSEDELESAGVVGVDSSGFARAGESDRVQLLAGKITREDFLERMVERSTAHLVGMVETSRLEMMRDVLRKQLADDPTLFALAERAMTD